MSWILATILAPFMTAINHALVVGAMTFNLILGGAGHYSQHIPLVQLSVQEAHLETGATTIAFRISVAPQNSSGGGLQLRG